METPLEQLAIGQRATVTSLALESQDSIWLRAVGLCEGRSVTVLRRAPWGGPLHVRLGGSGEFAVDRRLAKSIGVAVEGRGLSDG